MVETVSRYEDHDCGSKCDSDKERLFSQESEDRLWTESYNKPPIYSEIHHPQYCLQPELIRHERYKNPLHILHPDDFPEYLDDYEAKKYFSHEVGLFDREIIITSFLDQSEANLERKDLHRPAKLEIKEDNTVNIQLGIRRSPVPIPEEEIAKAVYYFGSCTDNDENCWTYHRYNKRCYPELIRPHVEKDMTGTATPFDWTYHRTQIAAGFARVMGFLREAPPDYLATPFKRIAKKVCNTVPENMIPPRKYELTAESRQLLSMVQSLLGEKFCPETACFILENAESFKPEDFANAEIISLLEQIPSLLENGLIIDRLSELFTCCLSQHIPEAKALKLALSTVTAIYINDENPWWFKEDIDFKKLFDEQQSVRQIEIINSIAKASGPAFMYTLQLYEDAGIKLTESDKLDPSRTINLCAKITQLYGIGNPKRAQSVLKFAEAIIDDTPPNQIDQALELFLEHAKTGSHRCQIINKMEGEETSIDCPGMTSLLIGSIGLQKVQDAQLDRVTLGPDNIKALVEPLALPLAERAVKPPTFNTHGREALLTPHIQTGNLLPTTATNTDIALAHPEKDKSILHRVLEFYRQLREECEWQEDVVAGLYFSACAQKMPDPLKPPSGFLRFLHRWDQLPVRGYHHEFFSKINEREEVRERNKKAIADKQQLIINLLDAWVLGIYSEDTLMQTLNWMTEDASTEKKADIAQEVIATNKQYKTYGGEEEDTDETAEERTARNALHLQWDINSKVQEYEKEVWQNRVKVADEMIKRLINIFYVSHIGLVDPELAQDLINKQLHSLRSNETDPTAESTSVDRFGNSIRELFKAGIIDEEQLRLKIAGDKKSLPEVMSALFEVIEAYDASMNIEEASNKDDAGNNSRLATQISEIAKIWQDLRQECIETLDKILVPDYLERTVQTQTRCQLVICLATDQPALEIANKEFANWNEAQQSRNVQQITTFTVKLVTSIGVLATETQTLLPESEETDTKAHVEDLINTYKAQIAKLTPRVREGINRIRRRTVGLVPVGGKIHVLHPINSRKFDDFKTAFGIQQTGFQLIHANTSMLLPVTPSANELAWIVSAMESLQIIDTNLPELQMSIPGRLPPTDCALLGSAIMLATERGKEEYDRFAFCTTHDSATGARMMAYDAGETPINMPFMPPLRGRTDMLGRRSLDDLNLYQQLGTILLQRHANEGPFGHLADEFEMRYRQILEKYNLTDVLNSSWVYTTEDDRSDDEVSEQHYLTIKSSTEAYNECAANFKETKQEEGIIFEVRALVDWLEENISKIQKTIYDPSNPACKSQMLLI